MSVDDEYDAVGSVANSVPSEKPDVTRTALGVADEVLTPTPLGIVRLVPEIATLVVEVDV